MQPALQQGLLIHRLVSRIGDVRPMRVVHLTVRIWTAIMACICRGKAVEMTKRTYQPRKLHRQRVHGFRARMSSRGGRMVLRARRMKGRKRISL